KAQKIIDENPNASVQELFNKIEAGTNLSIIEANELIKESPQGIEAEAGPVAEPSPEPGEEIDYTLHPDESIPEYNARIALARGEGEKEPEEPEEPEEPGEPGEPEVPEVPEEPVEGKAFQESEFYKNLPADERALIDEIFGMVRIKGGEEKAQRFFEAFEAVEPLVDPIFKAKLTLGLAEIKGIIAEQNEDYRAQKEIYERARDEILKDVTRNRGFYTLEQQGDIARLARGYGEDILNIADVAAEKGITFATGARSRVLAEERRKEQYQDVVQSGTRRYNLQMKELELRASRGETKAQKQLEALQESRTLQLQKIGRGAEELLGTQAITGVSGLEEYQRVGEMMGTVEEQKRKDIRAGVKEYLGFQF
ncbi:MAG: hypothetical protein P9M03_10725, partial [Candidatus Theseobacter exili]|nr:hypothetical protein [Candidatus Theseobacter exili]